jgi:hypothetical protein
MWERYSTFLGMSKTIVIVSLPDNANWCECISLPTHVYKRVGDTQMSSLYTTSKVSNIFTPLSRHVILKLICRSHSIVAALSVCECREKSHHYIFILTQFNAPSHLTLHSMRCDELLKLHSALVQREAVIPMSRACGPELIAQRRNSSFAQSLNLLASVALLGEHTRSIGVVFGDAQIDTENTT